MERETEGKGLEWGKVEGKRIESNWDNVRGGDEEVVVMRGKRGVGRGRTKWKRMKGWGERRVADDCKEH